MNTNMYDWNEMLLVYRSLFGLVTVWKSLPNVLYILGVIRLYWVGFTMLSNYFGITHIYILFFYNMITEPLPTTSAELPQLDSQNNSTKVSGDKGLLTRSLYVVSVNSVVSC